FYTLSQIESLCPSAVVTRFGVNVGSNNPSYDVETDLVSFNNTAYDFEPASAPTSATVTIEKFVNGVLATADNTNSASFPMQSSWNAANLGGAGSGTYALDASDSYTAQTAAMDIGSSYTTSENLPASCTGSNAYALAGYSTSNISLADAEAQATTTDTPNFASLSSNGYVVVRNISCAPASTYKVHILKYLNGVEASAASANNYLFPMTSTWTAGNLNGGAQSSGSYTLGNSFGGAADAYGADTAGMTGPYSYTTGEVTADIDPTSKVVASKAQCVPGDYYLVGYTASDSSFADAVSQATSTEPVEIEGASSDHYLIVSNNTCPITSSLTITKSS